MIVRSVLASLLMLVMICSVRAEITDGNLVAAARAYRDTIAAMTGTREAADVLRALNEARRRSDAAAIVRESEALAAIGANNVQTWIDLSKAWRETDPAADKGLAAAIHTTTIVAAGADRLEALLLASSFLRARLTAERAEQDAAVLRGREARQVLDNLMKLTTSDDVTGPDAENPDGRVAALRRTLEEASAAVDEAAAAIAATAASLDEVYREISGELPNVDPGALAAADDRLAFALVEAEDNGGIRPEFQFSGTDVRACVRFNRPLKDNSRIYSEMVTVVADGVPLAPQDYDVLAEGNRICLLRLEHDISYDVTFAAGLPALDESVVGEAQTVFIELEDAPSRIAFGAAEIVLPRSGPGEIPITLTNKEDFPLAIHRVVNRSLNRHIALGHLRNGISAAEYRQLLSDFSELLWEGQAERVMDDDEANTLVRTFVPVRSILDDRAAWLASLDRTHWQRSGATHSMRQVVRNISDEALAIEGSFVAGRLDVNDETADLYVPGIYALVTPVADTGPNQKFHCENSSDSDCEAYAAQWFVVSDIGLSFFEGERDFTVLARSLSTGGPVAGAKVQLVSRGNRVLAEGTSDANGLARFSRTLTSGEASNALVAVLAEADRDFNFIAFGSERLDLSRLNLHAVRDEPSGAALYTDRGIYQPGETAEVLALLQQRGPTGRAGHQLRLEIGDYVVKSQPIDAAEWKDGGMLAGLTIPATARQGTAVLKLLSPAGDTLAAARLRIDKIRPDRARIEFQGGADAIAVAVEGSGARVTGKLRVQYLYGSQGTGQGAASDLKAEVSVRVAPVAEPFGACYRDYAFGRFDDPGLQTVSRNFIEYTDADGALSLRLAGVRLPDSTRPLAATVEVTVFDASGPVASGQTVVSVPMRDAQLGLARVPRLSIAPGGYTLGVDLALLDRDGAALNGSDVAITLEREHEAYAWENVDGVWQHVRLQRREEVAAHVVPLAAGTPVAAAPGCAAPVRLSGVATGLVEGRYVLTAMEPVSGAITTVRFNTGSAQTSPDDLEPNIFVLSSDKERYAPGETVTLTVQAPFAEGEVLVAIAAGDVLAWHPGTVRGGLGTVTFPADAAWAGRGLHALATAFKRGDGARSFGPTRAIGATYLEISSDARSFEVSVRLDGLGPDKVLRPGEPLSFDVCVGMPGAPCGEGGPQGGHVVAFVVDEGLISLTGHEAEMDAMGERLLGRESLALRIMDNYGRLLLREGGDRPGRLALSNYTSSRIVAAASGPVALTNGRARFTFDELDMQAGSLKIFVLAWSPSQVGSARETVPVRHMLVSQLGVPEFFLAGDEPLLPLRMENVSFIDHDGDYALALSAEGGIEATVVARDGNRLPTDAEGRFLTKIPAGSPQDLFLAVKVPDDAEGAVELALDITAISARADLPPAERRRTFSLDVRPSGVIRQQYLSFPLGSRPVDLAALLEGLVDGLYDIDTVKVVARFAGEKDTLRIASGEVGPEQPPPILDEMVWLGMVGLQETGGAGKGARATRVQEIVDAVQALQLPDGAFVPYRTTGDFLPAEVGFDKATNSYAIRHGLLRTVSALDFLLRAQSAGYAVAPDALRNSMAFLEARIGDAMNAVHMGRDSVEGRLLCSFNTRYSMLVLVQQDRLTETELSYLDFCAPGGEAEDAGFESDGTGGSEVLSDLVNLAVLGEFGHVVDPTETLEAYYDSPRSYLADLDNYRRAIGLSMLANAGVDAGIVDTIAETFSSNDAPLDLRTRAWLARSVADLGAASGAGLVADDIEPSDPDLMILDARADGVVESGEMSYADIARARLTVGRAGGPDTRGFLRVGGRLLDPDAYTLPPDSMRQRLFDAVSGREIDPSTTTLQIGQRLIVTVEATSDALAAFADRDLSDIGAGYGALAVQAALPSALALTSDSIAGVKLRGDLIGFAPVGDMRSLDSNTQTWRAIIVPTSSDAVRAHPGGETDEEGESEEEEVAAEPGFEFRQAFTATVMAAGAFQYPALTVDPLDHPGDTLIGQPGVLRVEVPAAQ